MSVVAVLGGGAGGAAAAADLSRRGHEVRLWSPSATTVAPFAAAGGVRCEGVLGEGLAPLARVDAELAPVLDGADVALVCIPALGLDAVLDAWLACGADLPVVLDPGHTGSGLRWEARVRAAGGVPPVLAELSTLTYVARKPAPDAVRVTGVAGRVRAAALPGGAAALEWALRLYPQARPERDVLATGLSNVNLVLHPPAAVLGAAWVEATGGDFAFYAEGTTPGVARVMATLDGERLAVARAYGHQLDPLQAEMAAIGTAAPDAADLRSAVADGEANRSIRAPDSLEHRYYAEDFGYGLLPFCHWARIAAVDVPVAEALLRVADTCCPGPIVDAGLSPARMGIAGLDRDALLRRVREPVAEAAA